MNSFFYTECREEKFSMKAHLLLMCMSITTLTARTQWQLPPSSRRYNEVCYLTSHNSYAAKNHGYYYAQQTLTLEEQLKLGVRGFMLDTWLDRSKNVVLCHGGESITRLICMGKAPSHLSTALKPFKQFLLDNPLEVITIFLENYVKDQERLDEAFKTAGLQDFILQPKEWNPDEQNGWPTLEWMQKENKRLVIFTALEETSLAYHQWEHVVENQWGTLHPGKASKERKESRAWRKKTRYLYIVNYFPWLRFTFGDPYAEINTKGLKSCLKHIFKGLDEGYAHERLPNFLSLDYVDKGDAMQHITSMNASTHYFRPL
jgi:hypothetical protein